ncbi:mucin-associated surface protein (MASP), putative [Trypanosoma cruzi marinkellei]|uniref:Mucin-associated surface protein (MASP), putative n=1 Tax=Trypanosoma cruzi marinkellei TaxID=85056 RepID=K2N2M7_TRYCR|nr:mucin-associated surface protein (MASP), putative [Trypanosoma cruzi marinkellei]
MRTADGTVRGSVTCLSFCFLLCVDGELVCAEGCTQVTGVMAMMMTGRVLLVCALCVLWCGVYAVANVGDDVEMELEEESESLPSGRPGADEGGQRETKGSFQPESETAKGSLGAGKAKDAKQQDGFVITTAKTPDGADGKMKAEKSKTQEEKVVTEQTENILSPNKDVKTLQLTSARAEEEVPARRGKASEKTPPGAPPATPGVMSPAENGNSAENSTVAPGKEIVISEDIPNQSRGNKNPEDGLAAAMSSTKKMETAEARPSPPEKNETPGDSKARTNNEETSPEGVATMKKREILLDEEVANKLQKEGLASTTSNQEGGSSDGHAELTPPTNSATSNAANADADTDTDKGIPNNNLEADGPATAEAHQDEKKEENTQEPTPPNSSAIINQTLPPGDSDSSTAVSHTTSPLFLLIVVCAAAAAAVVAA